jgi:arabinan endo-1,5-alpha-L-arabinosidase
MARTAYAGFPCESRVEVQKIISAETFVPNLRFMGVFVARFSLFLLAGLGLAGAVSAQTGLFQQVTKVHDPSTILVQGGTRWCFSTGNGIQLMRQKADLSWESVGPVLKQMPAWHQQEVPANRGHLWAPDFVKVGNSWFLYYSVSSFGSNHSDIGLLKGREIDPSAPGYGWQDGGVAVRSRQGDHFNAIDPSVLLDGRKLWMAYGSFWDGIFLTELDPDTGLQKKTARPPRQIAMQKEIEAPYLYKQGKYYYLFVNWGLCCRGVDSTYEIRMGRSRDIDGPYLDKDGVDMAKGGGSLLLGSEGRFIGPGHASIFHEHGKDFFAHHYYDGESRGLSKLRILPLDWKDGWPVLDTKAPVSY